MAVLGVSMGLSLQRVGLSAARGMDLVVTRDQIEGSLPRTKGLAEAKPEAVAPEGRATMDTGATSAKPTKATKATELSPEQRRQVQELARIDQEVRAHEAAHLRAGAGVVTSGAQFSYTYGPDGKQYAVAGEVGIDTSPERKPEDNIDKGQRIQIAALAPADPSPQDVRVAAIGSRIEQMGYRGLAEQEALAAAQQAEARQAHEAEEGKPAPDEPRANLETAYPSATIRRGGLSLFA